MIPSSLLGLVLFVVLLAPGLAYVLRHERSVPAVTYSAFRETLRVVFASVTCLTVTGLLFAGLRFLVPEHTPDVRRLVQEPIAYIRGHHVQFAWWSFVLVVFATLLGFLAADPRFILAQRKARSNRFWRWLLGESAIRPSSAWRTALIELKPSKADETLVGVQMVDGAYIQGYLVSANPSTTENDQREIVLTRAKLRTAEGAISDIGATFTVVSARHIVRLDVTHLEPLGAGESSGKDGSEESSQ